MKIPEGLQMEYDTRAKKKREQTRGREVRRLKRKADWGKASADRAAGREKMRMKMKTSGYSSEQLANGLLVSVNTKKKGVAKKKAAKKKMKPKVKGTDAFPLKTLADVKSALKTAKHTPRGRI